MADIPPVVIPKQKNNQVQDSREIDHSDGNLTVNYFGKDRVKRNESAARLSKESASSFLPDIHENEATRVQKSLEEGAMLFQNVNILQKAREIERPETIPTTLSPITNMRGESTSPAHRLDDSISNSNSTDRGQLMQGAVQASDMDDQISIDSDQSKSGANSNSGRCCVKVPGFPSNNEIDAEESNQMKIEESKEYVENLIKSQEELYHKKFAFGRGRFQECIPNPDPARPNEMITVQLVNRIFKELEQSGDSDKLTLYKKYMVQQTQDGRRALYGDIDKVSGVSASHYGNVEGFDSNFNDTYKALTTCEEYAIIAFWSLHPEDDTFECDNFFYVPNPYKRTIRKDDDVELSQVLYSSPHTNDIYFFYKGYDLAYSNSQRNEETQVMKCVILRNSSTKTKMKCQLNADHELRHITIKANEMNSYACGFRACEKEKITTKDFFRCDKCDYNLCLECEQDANYHENDLRKYCQSVVTIDEGSLLHKQIEELHFVAFENQAQQPNPMLIDTVSVAKTDKRNAESGAESEKTVVFTSCRLISGEKSWYPSVFFHDLDRNETTWQIPGAEIFVSIEQKVLNGEEQSYVTVLTNEIWSKLTQEEYERKQTSNEFSRHRDYNTYMIKLRYLAKRCLETANPTSLMTKQKNQIMLNFQNNSRLDITNNAKVVEVYQHDEDRLTLLYQNLGSFTFDINEPQKLHQPQSWYIKCGKLIEERLLRLDLYQDDKNERRIQLIDQQREVQIVFDPIESSDWEGNFCGDADQNKPEDQLYLHALCFIQDKNDRQIWSIEGTASDSQQRQMSVVGSIEKETEIELSLKYESQQKTQVFRGTIDLEQVHMIGKWEGKQDQRFFEFDLSGMIKGRMELQFSGWPNLAQRIQIDLNTMKIQNIADDNLRRSQAGFSSPRTTITPIDDTEERVYIDKFQAVSHHRKVADICFFIQNRDVNFLRIGQGEEEKAYIQANLQATSGIKGDQARNGLGVAQATITLYDISETVVESNTYGNQQVAVVGAPNGQKHLKFGLNETFLRTQEKNIDLLYHVCKPIIGQHNVYDDKTREFETTGPRLFGSVIYEDYSTGILSLNFFTASLDETSKERDYPQQPLSQQMIVDYPYLAYKTVSPKNNEIAIVHMAQDVPQKLINLGEMRFVCFVGHTQMAEQRLFEYKHETNCDIMFLVQFGEEHSLRLVSLKMNPWLKDDDDKDYKGSDIYKHDLFIFSGSLNEVPEQENQTTKQDYIANRKKHCRRFHADKIQTAELITDSTSGYNQYMVVIQFNDSIASASLNTCKMKIECESQQMVRRHMVRGYDDRIFYCESNGAQEAIIELDLNTKVKNQITREQIQTFNGSRIVAFELDNDCILNDHLDDIRQSLYVMDDRARVYRLENPDGERYIVSTFRDLNQHTLRDHFSQSDDDWDRLHMTEKTVTYDATTYNVENNLSVDVQVPSNDAADEWVIFSAEVMSMTTNQISVCQTKKNDFCFFVKPAPSQRKLTIMGFKFLHAIEKMLFISNEHVLCKFSGGQTVSLHKNGDIFHQNDRVQNLLDQESSLVADQAIQDNNKLILLEQSDKDRYILIRFDEFGEASEAGIFKDIFKQMDDQNENIEAVEYQKEFFITADGEILTFAAIVDQGLANDETTCISEYQIKSTEEDKSAFEFKVILLHCRTEREQQHFVRHSQLCVVGNTLCYRRNNSPDIQILKLKNKSQTNKKMKDKKRTFSIEAMIHDPRDLQQIQMTQISEALHKTVKEKKGDAVIFVKEMLQITVRSDAILIALDGNDNKDGDNIREISQIESMQPLLNADKTVRSRFVMTKIQKDDNHQTTYKSQIDMSMDCNLRIESKQEIKSGNETKFGMLYRTFTEMNLWQLNAINKAIESRQKIDKIGSGAILSIYDGQTIFSIFSGTEEVYDQILEQLKMKKFKDEQDEEGQDCENNYLRRLYRILVLYVPDIKKEVKQLEKKQSIRRTIENFIGIDQSPTGKATGMKSITRKSLYFISSSQAEVLMELAMMCRENSLTDFVGDLSDFTFLINSMSPVVRDLITNSFKHSAYTQNVKNIPWEIGGNKQQVFGTQTQLICQQHPQLDFAEVKKELIRSNPLRLAVSCFQKHQFQMRQVEVEMLDIGWIFANECDVQKLICALKGCPYDSIFSTDLVIGLVDIFYKKYRDEILLKCFLPYVVYFLTTIIFFELFTSAGIHMNNEDEKWAAYVMAFVIIVLDLYFLFFELVVIARDGFKEYIASDFFNYVDVITSVLNAVLVYWTFTETSEDQNDRNDIKNWTILAILLMWTNLFDWYNLANSYFSLYWRVIKATLVQISSVVVIYVSLLMGFGNALMVRSEGRADGTELFSNFFSTPIFDSLLNLYMLSLGEFESLGNQENKGLDTTVWLVFVFATFIVQILFLNLLIAAMGDTYDMVKDTEKQSALKASIQLMSDYSVVVSRFSRKEQQESRFVYVTKNTAHDDEGGDWEGKLAQLKRHFNVATDAHNVEVTTRIARVDKHLAKQKTKLIELHNNQKSIIPQIKASLKTDMNEMKSNQIDLADQLKKVQETLDKVLARQ